MEQRDTASQRAAEDITPAEALAYELKVKEVMTCDVLVVAPDDQMAFLLSLLQEEQISGAPVVLDGKLAGIVSVKDLVCALKQGDLEAPVRKYMTECPHTVRTEDFVVQAIEMFARTQVGRLPVVDEENRLVGIVTKGDIATGLLRALQAGRHDEDLRRYRASHLFEDIVSDRTSLVLRYRVQPRDFSNGGMASAHVRLALIRLGASLEVARRCAIAVYEAEMNLVIHTINGGIVRVEVQPHAIFVEALDDGPGIEDVERAMQPGYTTTPPEIKALGFGAGFGLNNIKRCVDKMWLQSKPGEGTQLEMWIYLQPDAEHRTLETILDRMST